MVKFGGHVEAIRDGDLVHANLYLVPYNQMKKHIEHTATTSVVAAVTATATTAAALATEQQHQQQDPSTVTVKDDDADLIKNNNNDVDGLSTTTTVSMATVSTGATTATATTTAPKSEHQKTVGDNKGAGEAAAAVTATKIPDTVEVLPHKHVGESEEHYFIRIWKKSLHDAEEDLRIAREDIWRMVFDEFAAAAAAAEDDENENEENNNDDDKMNVHEMIRGVNPGNAFKLYVDLTLRRQYDQDNNNSNNNTNNNEEEMCTKVCCSKAQELLVRLKKIHRAATTNSEGLRKLVKKCDKKMNRSSSSTNTGTGTRRRRTNEIKNQLSSTLLPLLYTSSLYTSQTMLYDGIEFLRDLLSDEGGVGNTSSSEYEYGEEYYKQRNSYANGTSNASDTKNEDTNKSTADVNVVQHHNHHHHQLYDSNFKPLIKRNSELRHQESMDNRMMELDWLKLLVKSIPHHDLLPKLVSHRGFHSIKDHSDKRPLENSLSAYEIAWTSGIELCECDIALTKDEKLVLAHDANFLRLSLDQGRDGASKKRVGDLTFKELISLPLINGVRPPLLIDVLRSASAISEKSKLVIEIKPGNTEAAIALSRMLVRHPDLRCSVAMIMSFDVGTMHRLRARLSRATTTASLGGSSLRDSGSAVAHHHHNKNATDSQRDLLRDSASSLQQHHRRVTSYDHFGTTHRRVTSYDHFGTMTAASPMISPILGPLFDPSIGLSISHMDLNDATHAPPPPLPPAAKSTIVPNVVGGASAAATPLTTKSTIVPGVLVAAADKSSMSKLPGYVGGGGGGSAAAAAAAAATMDKYSMPKLMLLTVADSPQKPCELQVQYDELHRVDKWLTEEDGALDGVYLQFEKQMTTKEGADHLRKLSQRCTVGIWNYAERDPDDYDTFQWLVKEGNCTFVNTDLPKSFRNEILFQNQQRASRSSPPRSTV